MRRAPSPLRAALAGALLEVADRAALLGVVVSEIGRARLSRTAFGVRVPT